MQRANILKIAVVIAVVAVFSVLCFMLWQLNRSFEQSGARLSVISWGICCEGYKEAASIPKSDHLGTAGNNNAGERETRRKAQKEHINSFERR